MNIHLLLEPVTTIPLETFQFMLAGFAVIFLVIGGYALSLWLRFRSMNRKLHMLEISRERAISDLPTRDT